MGAKLLRHLRETAADKRLAEAAVLHEWVTDAYQLHGCPCEECTAQAQVLLRELERKPA